MKSSCQCDDQCGSYGDCCSDYKELCDKGGKPMNAQCDKDAGSTDAGPTDTGPKDAGCQPQCQGKTCGSDGCGGTCGKCPWGTACAKSGLCQGADDAGGPKDGGCTPQCAGKVCGADGCGGSCGSCNANGTCNSSGQCVGASDAGQEDLSEPHIPPKDSGGTGDASATGDQAGSADAAVPVDGAATDGTSKGDAGQRPIGQQDGSGQPVAMAHVTGSSSACQAGNSRPAGGLSLLLCLLLLAWRRRESRPAAG